MHLNYEPNRLWQVLLYTELSTTLLLMPSSRELIADLEKSFVMFLGTPVEALPTAVKFMYMHRKHDH